MWGREAGASLGAFPGRTWKQAKGANSILQLCYISRSRYEFTFTQWLTRQ